MGQIILFGKDLKAGPSYQQASSREIHIRLGNGLHLVKSGVYKLDFNGKIYIGKSDNIRKRAKVHMVSLEKMLRANECGYPSYEKMYAWLILNPLISYINVDILEECSTDMPAREQYWLDVYKDDPRLLNLTTKSTTTSKDKSKSEFIPGTYTFECYIGSVQAYLLYKKVIKQLSHFPKNGGI